MSQPRRHHSPKRDQMSQKRSSDEPKIRWASSACTSGGWRSRSGWKFWSRHVGGIAGSEGDRVRALTFSNKKSSGAAEPRPLLGLLGHRKGVVAQQRATGLRLAAALHVRAAGRQSAARIAFPAGPSCHAIFALQASVYSSSSLIGGLHGVAKRCLSNGLLYFYGCDDVVRHWTFDDMVIRFLPEHAYSLEARPPSNRRIALLHRGGLVQVRAQREHDRAVAFVVLVVLRQHHVLDRSRVVLQQRDLRKRGSDTD